MASDSITKRRESSFPPLLSCLEETLFFQGQAVLSHRRRFSGPMMIELQFFVEKLLFLLFFNFIDCTFQNTGYVLNNRYNRCFK